MENSLPRIKEERMRGKKRFHYTDFLLPRQRQERDFLKLTWFFHIHRV